MKHLWCLGLLLLCACRLAEDGSHVHGICFRELPWRGALPRSVDTLQDSQAGLERRIEIQWVLNTEPGDGLILCLKKYQSEADAFVAALDYGGGLVQGSRILGDSVMDWSVKNHWMLSFHSLRWNRTTRQERERIGDILGLKRSNLQTLFDGLPLQNRIHQSASVQKGLMGDSLHWVIYRYADLGGEWNVARSVGKSDWKVAELISQNFQRLRSVEEKDFDVFFHRDFPEVIYCVRKKRGVFFVVWGDQSLAFLNGQLRTIIQTEIL